MSLTLAAFFCSAGSVKVNIFDPPGVVGVVGVLGDGELKQRSVEGIFFQA